MKTINLAILGFGFVGRAFVQMLVDKKDVLEDFGIDARIVGVSDMFQGAAFDKAGLDMAALIASKKEKGGLGAVPGGQESADNDRLLDASGAHMLVEVSFTNPEDGEPARSFCNRAAKNGLKIITTNKGPTAFGMEEIETANPGSFGYEGSVMAGTPVISFVEKCLPGATVTKFRGILNGTSNYILGQMEQGTALDAAVKDAQVKGYAEADPTADIEGFDVMMKVIIMSSVLFGKRIGPHDVNRSGITGITQDMIADAAKNGKKWKLIGSGVPNPDGSYTAKVGVELLDSSDVLYGISGATNAIAITTQELGDIMVAGPGAGLSETAYALFADLLFAYGDK